MNPTEHLQAAQRAELECLTGMFDAALDGLDQLTRLQLQAMRELAQDSSQAMRTALEVRDPQEWAAWPAQSARGDGARAARYVQQLGEIAGAMQAGFTQALQQGMDSMQRNWKEAAEAAPLPASGDGQTDWMRGTADLLAQAMQSWTRSQTQAARAMSEQMQRLAQTGAQGAAQPEPAPAAPAAGARTASRRAK